MRDRHAQFAIYSAADPRRHCLRYVLIEASFPQDMVANEEASNSIREENTNENNQAHDRNNPNVQESTPSQCMQQTDKETKGAKRSLEQQSNYAVESKRRKMEDGSSQKEDIISATGADILSYWPNITKREKEGHASERNANENAKGVPIDGIKGKGCTLETLQADRERKVKRVKTEPVQDTLEHNNEDEKDILIKGHGTAAVAHRQKALTIATSSNSCKALVSKLQTMLVSEKRDEQMKKVETNTGCSNGSSVGSTLDEDMASTNMEANNNMKSFAEVDEDERAVRVVDDDSNVSTISDSQKGGKSISRNSASKIDPNISAYMEGTNLVTGSIVDLWREYKEILGYSKEEIQQRGSSDLSSGEVHNKLLCYPVDELQAADHKGYTALLKACSLPQMSPHVMQYLITSRKVDLNCTLPSALDMNDPTAKKLVPGMFALSVAIRRGNVKSVSTFMTRPGDINVRSKDCDGNTALHHCVLSHSKSSFQKLFPLYKPLEWKEMRNNEGKNPLDICVAEIELREGSKQKEKSLKTLLYMRQEMERVST